MELKYSRYNIAIERENMVLLYNSFNNHYIGISHKCYEAFVAGDFSILEARYPKSFTQLREKGFIILENVDELAILRYRNKVASFSSKQYQLMLFPTQDCNLKCWYCYESHIPGSRMPEEVMQSIVKHFELVTKEQNYTKYRLSFFGGEPLLGFHDIAYPLCKAVKDVVEASGADFECFFVTNASLIDRSVIEKFKEINPYLQITIDGSQDKHDRVRIWKKTDAPTYHQIVKAVRDITQEVDIPDFGLTLRLNYDNDTLRHVRDIIKDLDGVNKRKIRVHLERVWQTLHLVDEEQRTLLMEAMEAFIGNGFVVDHGAFRPKNYSCPAECNHYAIVNHDGLVYKCNGRTLKEEQSCGKLLQSGYIQWNEYKLAQRMGLATFENPICLQCKMLPMCMGPCSQKLMENGGFKPHICTMRSVDAGLKKFLYYDFCTKLMLQKYY